MSCAPLVASAAPATGTEQQQCLMADGQLHCPSLVAPRPSLASGPLPTPNSPPSSPSFLTQAVKRQPRSERLPIARIWAGWRGMQRLQVLVQMISSAPIQRGPAMQCQASRSLPPLSRTCRPARPKVFPQARACGRRPRGGGRNRRQ